MKYYAKSNYGVDMSDLEAKQYRSNYFRLYAGIKQWHNEQRMALDDGMSEVRTRAGRVRRWTPDKKPWVGIVLNTPVQGTAADGLKQGQIMLHKRLKEYGNKARVINVVHDELVLEVTPDLVSEVKEVLERSMIEGMEAYVKDVPIVVEAVTGATWAVK